MKDQLEDFIQRNKDAFDHREPSGNIWLLIERALFSRKSLWNSVAVWRAAAVIFMLLSAYLLIPRSGAERQGAMAMKEFTDVEKFYTEQISQKVALIDQFQQEEGLNGFTQDFHQLEAMYLVLKEELKVRPSKKVKEALVLNLLVRIDLLNQQLHKLDSQDEVDAKPASEMKSAT